MIETQFSTKTLLSNMNGGANIISNRQSSVSSPSRYRNMSPSEKKKNPESIVKNLYRTRQPEVLQDCSKKLHEFDVYLEKLRCKLALKVDFNLRDLFSFLDFSKKGFVDSRDMERVCKYLQIQIIDDLSKEQNEELVKDLIRMFI